MAQCLCQHCWRKLCMNSLIQFIYIKKKKSEASITTCASNMSEIPTFTCSSTIRIGLDESQKQELRKASDGPVYIIQNPPALVGTRVRLLNTSMFLNIQTQPSHLDTIKWHHTSNGRQSIMLTLELYGLCMSLCQHPGVFSQPTQKFELTGNISRSSGYATKQELAR